MISDDTSVIQLALDRTKKGFASGKLQDLDFRESQIRSLIKGFLELQPILNDALKIDLGYNDFACFYNSTGITLPDMQHTADNFRKWLEKKEVDTPMQLQPAKSYLIPEPYGVVLVIGPWNAPYFCTLPYVCSAIAAGNAVVVKPSELSPNSSKAIVELFGKYLDKDCFAVVEGGAKVASEICTHPWDYVIFTGGTEKGKKVAQACAANLVPYILELGGKSPVFVDKDADLDNAAMRLAQFKTLNWGQICVSPDYILAHKDIKEALLHKLKEYLIQFYGEDAQKSEDRLKIINDGHVARLEKVLSEDHGGKIVFSGGNIDKAERFIPPTVVDSPKLTSSLMTDEIFGPILPVLEIDSVDRAIAFINVRPKPLALYYFGSIDNPNKDKFIKNTSSGGVTVNDVGWHSTSTELPFGGVGLSGSGSVHGKYGFDNLTHWKPVMERETVNTFPHNLRFPPYGPNRIQEFLNLMAPPKSE